MAKFAVIGGSGGYDLLTSGAVSGERLGVVETPYGPSQPVFRVQTQESEFLFLSRHGEKGYTIAAPFVNYRANLYALKEHGAECVLAWSGPGAIDPNLEIGQFVLPDDLLDETKRREYTFFKNRGQGFIRQSPVFCPELREKIGAALTTLELPFATTATYVCTEGPRLETPAEIRKFALFGGHLVGMTLVPEVFLAKELEMCYAPICYVTNHAEGLRGTGEFRPGELFEGLLSTDKRALVDRAVQQFPAIITELARQMTPHQRTCHCPHLLARYRHRGDLGPDWRTGLGER